MDYEAILYEVKDSIAYITLNRPDSLNALNDQLLKDLDAALDAVKEDADVKVVVLTGSGEKAFAAGADITELNELSSTDAQEQSERGNRIFSK